MALVEQAKVAGRVVGRRGKQLALLGGTVERWNG